MDGQDFFINQFHLNSFDEDEFFSDIFQQIQHTGGLCSQKASDHNSSPVTIAADVDVSDISFNDNGLHRSASSNPFNSYMKQPVSAYTLSFDNSTVMPITIDSPYSQLQSALARTHSSPLSSAKRTRGNRNAKPRNKSRTSSETIHHSMAERKRRQDLAQKFIALSATIPGLKKIDKASVLCEAINYLKQLQERVRELENEEKSPRSVGGSMRNVEKSEVCCCCRAYDALPDLEARVLENQVLIRIHCERQKNIMLKMVALLENIHLSILSCSSLPFGNSAFTITIVAQMEDKYNMKVNDLVMYLRQHHLLKLHDVQ